MASTDFDLAEPDINDAAGFYSAVQNKQRWLLCQTIKSQFFGSRTRYTDCCWPGWDTTFVGTWPEFTQIILTEEGGSGRKVRYNLTWTSGVITAQTIQYDDGTAGYVTVSNPSNTDSQSPAVITDRKPVYDYTVPHQSHLIWDGSEEGDILYMRENWVILWLHIVYSGFVENQYFPLGGTVIVTPSGSSYPTQIDVTWGVAASGYAMRFKFTYFSDDYFEDGLRRTSTIQIWIRIVTSGSFYLVDYFEFIRKTNGHVLFINSLDTAGG